MDVPEGMLANEGKAADEYARLGYDGQCWKAIGYSHNFFKWGETPPQGRLPPGPPKSVLDGSLIFLSSQSSQGLF